MSEDKGIEGERSKIKLARRKTILLNGMAGSSNSPILLYLTTKPIKGKSPERVVLIKGAVTLMQCYLTSVRAWHITMKNVLLPNKVMTQLLLANNSRSNPE